MVHYFSTVSLLISCYLVLLLLSYCAWRGWKMPSSTLQRVRSSALFEQVISFIPSTCRGDFKVRL